MTAQIDYYSLNQLTAKYGSEWPQTIMNVQSIFTFINNLIHDNYQNIINGAYDYYGWENVIEAKNQWIAYAEEKEGWNINTLSEAYNCTSSFKGYYHRFKNQYFKDLHDAVAPLSFLMGRLKDDLECGMYPTIGYLEDKPLDIENFIIGYYEGKLLF